LLQPEPARSPFLVALVEVADLGIIAQVEALRRRPYPVRAYVSAIVAIILVPVLVMAGWLAVSWAASERAQLEQTAEHKSQELLAEIDREIVSATSMLTALATSHALHVGDFEAFHRKAVEVARQLGFQILLRDPQLDQQLVSTLVPWGGPPRQGGLAVARREAERQVTYSGKPAVSNSFVGPVTGNLVVSVVVPVMRNDAVAYLLSVGIPAKQFAQNLAGQELGPNRIATLLDGNNVIVARSVKHDEFAGRTVVVPPPPGTHGVVRAKSRDDVPFHWFVRRSDITGWTISIGVPDSVLEGPLRRALVGFAAAAGILFVVAIGASYYWAGRLSQSVGALGIDRKPTREEFQVLFDSAPNGVVVVDGDGLIALVNARMERMFGYSREQLIGQRVEALVPERLRGRHAGYRRRFAAAPEAKPMGAGRELFGLRKDGSEFPIEIGLNPIRTGAGNLVMATVVDITARKRSAQRLGAALAERDDLRRRFMQAQEQERLRLAHDLHDRTGQSLTAALLELKGIESSVDQGGRNRLRQLRRQMEEMGKTLHRVAWELRPASMDELGLASALANYVSEWSAQYGIEADFHCGDPKLEQLSDEVRTTIYRVVQEGLTNIAKHAQRTTTVSVVVERVDATLRLMIEDDGCGFGSGRSDGLGLAGMRERLALIGGTLEIESSIGAGTTIFARIPLERERTTA
jgi:two-component system sensor histidine kinase UhpB